MPFLFAATPAVAAGATAAASALPAILSTASLIGGSLFKMITRALADDSPNVPAVKLTKGQAGIADTLHQEFTQPGGPGYQPVGQGLNGLGTPTIGGGYRERLNQITQRLQAGAAQPLPGSTNQLPTGNPMAGMKRGF